MCIYDCMWNPTVRLLINRFLSYLINAFNSDLTLDPNVNYNILENMLTKLYEQHFSLKTVPIMISTNTKRKIG